MGFGSDKANAAASPDRPKQSLSDLFMNKCVQNVDQRVQRRASSTPLSLKGKMLAAFQKPEP
jgi:hypothetical protein